MPTELANELPPGFSRDTEHAPKFEQFYGEYVATFDSPNKQVKSVLYKRDGHLVAYTGFSAGLSGATVTDRYASVLHEFASSLGFSKDHFHIIYAE